MKKRVQLHAKDVMCYQENEEYYLNRFPKKAKTEDYAEALTQAEQGDFAWSKGGLKKQIVALTAENAELKKRLNTSMGEVLELDKENKGLKEHKVKT